MTLTQVGMALSQVGVAQIALTSLVVQTSICVLDLVGVALAQVGVAQ